MLVGERMSHPVISISPEMPIVDALNLMHREHIRRAPVVRDGKMIGIVSDKDLLNASPSPATSLSVWELNYLLTKEAARIMADNKIGGLPVVRGGNIVGMITETDLFKIFLELMGARDVGVRATVLVLEERGQLARLTQVIASAGGNFVAFGQFAGENPSNWLVTCKVTGLSEAQLRATIEPVVEKIIDIRTCP